MFHFILNSSTKGGKYKKILSFIEKQAKERGVKYELHFASKPHESREIAALLSREQNTIVVVGGDGTLHEVLNGISDFSKVTLALIPAGTGNDFAEAISLSKDVKKAISLVFEGEAKNTDYLTVGSLRSMNVAGLGMDVDVLERCYRGSLKGKIKYYLSLVQSVFSFRGYEVEYTLNGETKRVNALFACACNGRQIGGGIRICPTAQVDDGKLDFVLVRFHKGAELIQSFFALMKGKIFSSPKCEHILCEKVTITPVKDAPCQLDGELYSSLPFEAEIHSGLKFIRP